MVEAGRYEWNVLCRLINLGNNGTRAGTECPNLTTGMRGKAYKFDGIDDYVTAGSDSELIPATEVTIEAWTLTGDSKSIQFVGGRGNTEIADIGLGYLVAHTSSMPATAQNTNAQPAQLQQPLILGCTLQEVIMARLPRYT